jgi:hypothetical protein
MVRLTKHFRWVPMFIADVYLYTLMSNILLNIDTMKEQQ